MTGNFTAGNPAEMWQKLIENTTTTHTPDHSQDKGKGQDPWLAYVDQLWKANPYSKSFPFDPSEIATTFQKVWMSFIMDPTAVWNSYTTFVQSYTQVMTNTALRLWGVNPAAEPVITPEEGDKRFSAPDWQQNAVFDAIKQSYLLISTTLLKTAAETQGLDDKQKRKMVFYLRQFLDAISPTNFAFTNPQVIHETIQSGGKNLVTGLHNLRRDIEAGQIKMTNTDAFEPGRNLALTPGKVVYRNQLIELIQYVPGTEKVHAVPLLFMPPWINKYYILDMTPKNSLIKFLVDKGFSVFVISWKNPDASMENTSFEEYMTLGPLSAFKAIKDITGSPKVLPVGYCIGGTLLSMTLPYLKATGDDTVDAVTFLVALQDFSEVGDTSVFIDEPQIAHVEGQMLEKGYLDSKGMASMFNMLRANDLIWSNVVNNYLLGKEPPAFDLLYWNNDGTRMARNAHSFYLRNTYLENNLVKPGKICLKDVPIDLSRIDQDIYAVGAQQDHIVPWNAAWQIKKLAKGKVRFVLGGSGHIAGVISPPSKGRGYWTTGTEATTAEEWFEKAELQSGSWWNDWIIWLEEHTGELVDPPPVGNAEYPPLAVAPGTYVLEK